ncbi:MAG: hypothetical protein CMP10_01445 [Zetaproteobacteria bacterium]|nr:hypothetical protein [Pseudobdellovibrionaceae bacterium]
MRIGKIIFSSVINLALLQSGCNSAAQLTQNRNSKESKAEDQLIDEPVAVAGHFLSCIIADEYPTEVDANIACEINGLQDPESFPKPKEALLINLNSTESVEIAYEEKQNQAAKKVYQMTIPIITDDELQILLTLEDDQEIRSQNFTLKGIRPMLQGNLVADGSFESQLVPAGQASTHFRNGDHPFWQVEAGLNNDCPDGVGLLEIQTLTAGSVPASADGNQHVELDSDCTDRSFAGGNSQVFQDITTISGNLYQVSFFYRARRNTTLENLRVQFGEELLHDTPTTNLDWQKKSFQVLATSDSTRIHFSDTGVDDNGGTLLDKVEIYDLGWAK